jgi:hypothetical protein
MIADVAQGLSPANVIVAPDDQMPGRSRGVPRQKNDRIEDTGMRALALCTLQPRGN